MNKLISICAALIFSLFNIESLCCEEDSTEKIFFIKDSSHKLSGCDPQHGDEDRALGIFGLTPDEVIALIKNDDKNSWTKQYFLENWVEYWDISPIYAEDFGQVNTVEKYLEKYFNR